MSRLFGTDGARGVAITELTCELAMNIGRAAAIILTSHIKGNKRAAILVGKDTRISSDTLEAALVAGISSVGADAMILGVVPTPAVPYLVDFYKADAGVMISASHNSMKYNGIKLFSNTGFKLPDAVEDEIEALILDTPEKMELKSGEDIGRVHFLTRAVRDYTSHLLSTVPIKVNALKVVIDTANGSASATAENLFSGIGSLSCTFINNAPDGCNINKNCGSTHLEPLQKAVIDGKCDVGIAFDGDADRCLAVDENGKLVDGDRLIGIIAKHMKKQGKLSKNSAVVTIMSNLGFHNFMEKNDINTVCTKVGDRYVLEEMLKNGYNIGGEQSGHIIFLDSATTGDGQLTALKLLAIMEETGESLSELAADFVDYPQILVNVKISGDKRGLLANSEVWNKKIADITKEMGKDGRIVLRESGTEPLIRIMMEGKDEARIKAIVEQLETEIRHDYASND